MARLEIIDGTYMIKLSGDTAYAQGVLIGRAYQQVDGLWKLTAPVDDEYTYATETVELINNNRKHTQIATIMSPTININDNVRIMCIASNSEIMSGTVINIRYIEESFPQAISVKSSSGNVMHFFNNLNRWITRINYNSGANNSAVVGYSIHNANYA